MSTPPFVHLHCHSHYSLLDGASPIEGLVERAKALGMNALALTDHGNLHGALEFYQAGARRRASTRSSATRPTSPRAAGFTRRPASMKEASYHLTLLAQNRTGFQNLIKLASKAFLEGFYFKPRIDKELLEAHSEGLICLSGCVSGEFSRAILQSGQIGEPTSKRPWRSPPGFTSCSATATSSRSRTTAWKSSGWRWKGPSTSPGGWALPLVATSDAHYVNREDAEAQDVLLCINTGKFRTDTNRMRMEGDQFYLRSPEEMYAALPGPRRGAGAEPGDRRQRSTSSWSWASGISDFQPPPEKNAARLSARAVPGGSEGALCRRRRDAVPTASCRPMVHRAARSRAGRDQQAGLSQLLSDRLGLRALRPRAGHSGHGPRLGVGSLVAYALYLSHVCPLKYDLLFERFLDESRREAPDIDIDFCKDRRGEVIQYVKEKYGEANVAQIGTFGTLAARAAIRDVGRALGMPIPRVDAIVAMVPDRAGHHARRGARAERTS